MRRGSLVPLIGHRALAVVLIACLAFQSTSCGTLIHRERWGQRSGRLDPSIVMLDGLGLLVFLVPGVIAFVVDFATGAIYLPERYDPYPPPMAAPPPMTRIQTDPATLDKDKIEAIVRERTGRTVDLNAPSVTVRRVDDVAQASAVIKDAGTAAAN